MKIKKITFIISTITLLLFSCQTASTDQLIKYYAKQNDLDYNLVKAVVTLESSYNHTARSHKNARGLMQVVFKWHHKRCKLRSPEQLYNKATNLACGTKILKYYIELCGSEFKGLQCYNAGQTGASKGYGYNYAVNVLTIKQSLETNTKRSIKIKPFSLKPKLLSRHP